ncbi:MAG TPA: hypothetical protein VFZ66_09530 [Herpetosiphonaceae bacterium]
MIDVRLIHTPSSEHRAGHHSSPTGAASSVCGICQALVRVWRSRSTEQHA